MDKEVFVDANVFLEIFLKDSKSEECKNFLKSLQIYDSHMFIKNYKGIFR